MLRMAVASTEMHFLKESQEPVRLVDMCPTQKSTKNRSLGLRLPVLGGTC